MILARFFNRKPTDVQRLYGAIVASARQEKFYAAMAVPDTVDGRFDMIVLHLYLVLDRMRGEQPAFKQQLTDEFFKDMDRSLREMGVGDLSVSKKIRKMAEAFQGRLEAYKKAEDTNEEAFSAALRRNVYAAAKTAKPNALLAWAQNARTQLTEISIEQLQQAKFENL